MVRRRKIKISKWILPLTLILGLSVFIAAAAFYRPSQNTQTKSPATEYFEIVSPTTNYAMFQDDNKTILKIYALQFSIKAVKGPVHDVTVLSWANSEEGEGDVGDLQLGESKFVELKSSQGCISEREENGFPVEIGVTSVEAEGNIAFFLKYP